MARLLLSPVIAWLALERNYEVLLIVFGAAALTDAFDGWLARKLRVESQLGQVLDPLADKALLTVTFLALAYSEAIPYWLMFVVIGRDVAILVGAGLLKAFGKRLSFPPSFWGKVSTIFQMGYVLWVVLRGVDVPVAGYAVAALAAVSLGDYARRAF